MGRVADIRVDMVSTCQRITSNPPVDGLGRRSALSHVFLHLPDRTDSKGLIHFHVPDWHGSCPGRRSLMEGRVFAVPDAPPNPDSNSFAHACPYFPLIFARNDSQHVF